MRALAYHPPADTKSLSMSPISKPVRISIPPEDDSCAITVLAAALDQRDAYTDHHCDRVSQLAQTMGRHCGLDDQQLAHLVLAARFHDVGKIGIRDDVLLHPGRLDEDKKSVMRTHPERGARLFATTGRDDADAVARLILHHHEAWDGSGYPHGLQGEEIPLEARILTVVDAFDAMTSQRPYRDAMPTERVMEILAADRGQRIDPRLFGEFAGLLRQGALLA